MSYVCRRAHDTSGLRHYRLSSRPETLGEEHSSPSDSAAGTALYSGRTRNIWERPPVTTYIILIFGVNSSFFSQFPSPSDVENSRPPYWGEKGRKTHNETFLLLKCESDRCCSRKWTERRADLTPLSASHERHRGSLGRQRETCGPAVSCETPLSLYICLCRQLHPSIWRVMLYQEVKDIIVSLSRCAAHCDRLCFNRETAG